MPFWLVAYGSSGGKAHTSYTNCCCCCCCLVAALLARSLAFSVAASAVSFAFSLASLAVSTSVLEGASPAVKGSGLASDDAQKASYQTVT